MTVDGDTLVVLDRDGVVTVEVDGWISDPRDLRFETNAVAGLRRMTTAGVRTAIATNQSGIGRGEVSLDDVAAVHTDLMRRLRDEGVELIDVFVCPHVDADECSCRKPHPGLIHQAMRDGDGAPDRTWFVGDMPRDLHAGRAAGVHVALVRTGKGRETEAALSDGTPVFADLLDFAEWLIREEWT